MNVMKSFNDRRWSSSSLDEFQSANSFEFIFRWINTKPVLQYIHDDNKENDTDQKENCYVTE